MPPPPKLLAVLPETVESMRVTTPLLLIPPPKLLAVLPETVESMRVRSPRLAMPPPLTAEFPETVESIRVISPGLPMPLAVPPVSVSPTTVRGASATITLRTPDLLFASIVRVSAPGPVRVSSSVICSSVPPKVMVSVKPVNWISSLVLSKVIPLKSLLPAPSLALRATIASRRVIAPSLAMVLSARLVTVIIAIS